jgi:hypothetical protein
MAVAIVILAAVAVTIGSSRFALVASGEPRVSEQFSGVVSKVNGGQTQICMSVPSATEWRCGGLWIGGNETFPVVGDHIAVWVVQVPTDQGVMEQFILQPGSSAGT